VTVVVAAIALLKKTTIPRMKKEIPFTGHFDRSYAEQIKRPASAGLYYYFSHQKAADPSNPQLLQVRHVSSLQAPRVHMFRLQYSTCSSQEENLIITITSRDC
jgi:hypothetical protein